jgi:hypothetical protein
MLVKKRIMRPPTLKELIVPLAMIGGAIAGLLYASYDLPSYGQTSTNDVREAAGMLAVIYMFLGAIAGAVAGIIAALGLHYKKRWEQMRERSSDRRA